MSKLWEDIQKHTEIRPYNEDKKEDGKFNYVHQENVELIAKCHTDRIFRKLLRDLETLPIQDGFASHDSFKKSVISLVYQYAINSVGDHDDGMDGYINRLKEIHEY